MQFLKPLEVKIRQLRNQLTPFIYRGNAVQCPVCDHCFSHFLPAGSGERVRQGAVCPFCRARERDRLNWLFFKARPDLFQPQSMTFLHVAPEPKLSLFFRQQVGEGYISADLIRKDVMVKMDVSAMEYPDNHFDAIYCSHVFQDVPDDNKAIAECYRTLKPGGWAILNVPIKGEKTQQSTAPGNQRKTWDKRPDEHLRRYGVDYSEQLSRAGFIVDTVNAETLEPQQHLRERMGVASRQAGYVHFVRKPESTGTGS